MLCFAICSLYLFLHATFVALQLEVFSLHQYPRIFLFPYTMNSTKLIAEHDFNWSHLNLHIQVIQQQLMTIRNYQTFVDSKKDSFCLVKLSKFYRAISAFENNVILPHLVPDTCLLLWGWRRENECLGTSMKQELIDYTSQQRPWKKSIQQHTDL